MSGIAIKFTFSDTVVFDYIPFPIFTHTTGIPYFLDASFFITVTIILTMFSGIMAK